VWEKLDDVDGGWSAFVDSDFVESHPVGGDFAGETAESTLRAFEAATGQLSAVDPAEYVFVKFRHLNEIVLICNFVHLSRSQALARQLQAEEDAHAQQEYAKRLRQREERAETRQTKSVRFNEGHGGKRTEGKNQQNKEKKDKCIIM
jgi:hypothetical protein